MNARFLAPTLVLLSALSLSAQCYETPDNLPGAGSGNVIPFGDTDPQSALWSRTIYQQTVTAADLGNQPGVITALAFAPTGTGVRRFGSLKITLGHCTLGTLSTTFANNFTSPGQVVLDVTDFEWPNTADTWVDIPLQTPFVYIPPLGDLLIEMVCIGAGSPGNTSAGMRTGARQRMYNRNWGGPTIPTTGQWGGTAALKVRVCMSTAANARFGSGCLGTNNQAPTLSYSGSSRIGQILNVDLASARATTPYFTLLGTTIGAPYPVPLDAIGMPGCKLYPSILISFGGVTNASGTGSAPFPIPNDPTLTSLMLFHQCGVVDAGANALGLVTSNAGWFVVGN
jgi:hypothetical protein